MVFEQFNLVLTGHANGELQVRTWTRTIMMAPEISWLEMVRSSCYKGLINWQLYLDISLHTCLLIPMSLIPTHASDRYSCVPGLLGELEPCPNSQAFHPVPTAPIPTHLECTGDNIHSCQQLFANSMNISHVQLKLCICKMALIHSVNYASYYSPYNTDLLIFYL